MNNHNGSMHLEIVKFQLIQSTVRELQVLKIMFISTSSLGSLSHSTFWAQPVLFCWLNLQREIHTSSPQRPCWPSWASTACQACSAQQVAAGNPGESPSLCLRKAPIEISNLKWSILPFNFWKFCDQHFFSNTSQTIPKNWRGQKNPKIILQGYHYLNTQIKGNIKKNKYCR